MRGPTYTVRYFEDFPKGAFSKMTGFLSPVVDLVCLQADRFWGIHGALFKWKIDDVDFKGPNQLAVESALDLAGELAESELESHDPVLLSERENVDSYPLDVVQGEASGELQPCLDIVAKPSVRLSLFLNLNLPSPVTAFSHNERLALILGSRHWFSESCHKNRRNW